MSWPKLNAPEINLRILNQPENLLSKVSKQIYIYMNLIKFLVCGVDKPISFILVVNYNEKKTLTLKMELLLK